MENVITSNNKMRLIGRPFDFRSVVAATAVGVGVEVHVRDTHDDDPFRPRNNQPPIYHYEHNT
jgi:hypothetical protein